MTNEDMLADLKQFIEATVSQQMAHLATKEDIDAVEQRLSDRIDTLDEKLDLIQDAIAESFTEANKVTTATLRDHEQRLHRLEQRHA